MTPSQLHDAVGCTADLAERYAQSLTRACESFSINTAQRTAAFLAQLGHESGGFRYVRELWGPTPAQARYEGRADLGNTQPGDGARYLGRGLIQLTGRSNSRQARDGLRKAGFDAPDFESRPELLEDPEWACLVAAWFWNSRGCNELADLGDFESITRRINGGLNGLADRNARWDRAKKVLNSAPAPQPTEPGSKPVIPALIPSLFGALSAALPSLVKLIRPDSESAERNAKVSAEVLKLATTTLNAANAQEAVERVQSDPAAAAAVSKAVQDNWFELAEAGGGGIEGARKFDAAIQAAPGNAMLHSPSFWIAVMLLPLVYMLVASLIGLLGTATWSDDVRAGLAGSLISAIIGGLVGYYYGQITSRNRTATP